MGDALEIRFGAQSVRLTPAGLGGAPYVVGREHSDGLRIDDPLVSHRHLAIWHDGQWRVRNEGRNGTFHDGRPLGELAIGGPLALRLAGPAGPTLDLAPVIDTPPPAGPPTGAHAVPAADHGVGLSAVHAMGGAIVTVGRAPDNHIVLGDDVLVSRHHAQLELDQGRWLLRDLGSANGSYVDGRRVQVAPVGSGSRIVIGHRTFRLHNGMLAEYEDVGSISFEARDLVVVAGQHRILDGVSFTLEPDNMLVVIGPSGSGKTTLLRALTGTAPATTGQVGYGGRDLYSNYDEIRHRIGFVPQDDILHPQLRVHDALSYAGRLRFPADVDAASRERRVDEVIGELGLRGQAHQRVSTLSGGQRKRTSTAMELLTRPSLLFLDEPTSGLDVNRDREVMQMLRGLADGGRTVVVISHNVAYLELADRILVLAAGGQLAYFGPPREALAYFRAGDWADMYAQLEQPRHDWRARFEQSRLRPPPSRAPITGVLPPVRSEPRTRQQSAASQFRTLCARYAKVIVADKQFVALMIAMPIMLALFAHAVPGSDGLSLIEAFRHRSRSPIQLLLVLTVGACLAGSAGSVREIVKERAIFARERAIGLGWPPYLASKAVVLGVISGAQAIVLTLLGLAGGPPPDDALLGSSATFDVVLALVLTCVASMAVGLVISVLVTNADRTMPLLVLVIMAQLLLSGGLFPMTGRPVLEQLSWLAPARWGYAASAAVTDVRRARDIAPDPFWTHSTSTYLGDLFLLLLQTAAYLAVAALLIRRIGRIRSARLTPTPT